VSFTVVWNKRPQRELAQVWMDHADERNDITRAAADADSALRHDPLSVGEARSGSLRVACFHPLWIRFRVSEPDRLVTVEAVWHV
jgi:hypothetical protein